MTAIVAVNFDWSIESCDKAPRDLDYERNTEKYGRAMKLTISAQSFLKHTLICSIWFMSGLLQGMLRYRFYVFMPPALKKLGIILVCACACVRSCERGSFRPSYGLETKFLDSSLK